MSMSSSWFLLLAAFGCSRSEGAPTPAASGAAPTNEVAPSSVPAAVPTPSTAVSVTTPVAPAAFQEQAPKPRRYAVFDVKSDDVLNVRAEADSKSKKAYSFGPGVKTIRSTGKSQHNGTTHWVEVTFDGGTGWANRAFLTEVQAGGGCNDPNLTAVIRQFMRAVAAEDGTVLGDSVSPIHGLMVRYADRNPTVRIPHERVGELFTSATPQSFGGDGGSDAPLTKPWKSVVLPTLKDAISGKGAKEVCGKMLTGEGAGEPGWPAEFSSLTLVSFHTPGVDGKDWSSWIAGIEYVDEKPYVTALVGYRRGS